VNPSRAAFCPRH